MPLAADYPFMDILWTMILFFAWLAWFWMIVTLFTDIFRRRDIGGFAKAAWCVFLIVLPFLGVLIYLIAQHRGMEERQAEGVEVAQRRFDERVRAAAAQNGHGAADEIAKAQSLLASGAIDQGEFDRLKAKALA